MGIAAFVVGVLALVLSAVDGVALRPHEEVGTVVGRRFRELTTAPRVDVIQGRAKSIPQVTPPAWILELELDGRRIEAEVDSQTYRTVTDGAQVRVRYTRHRLTGRLEGISVQP